MEEPYHDFFPNCRIFRPTCGFVVEESDPIPKGSSDVGIGSRNLLERSSDPSTDLGLGSQTGIPSTVRVLRNDCRSESRIVRSEARRKSVRHLGSESD